jgi:hypothetical protein
MSITQRTIVLLLFIGSSIALAGDRFITGMKFMDTSYLELLSAPQPDAVVFATIPVSSIKFPVTIFSEQGQYWYIQVGGKTGWVKKYLVDINNQTNVAVSGPRLPPKTTMSTPGIDDAGDSDARNAAVDGAINQIGQELVKKLNLPK